MRAFSYGLILAGTLLTQGSFAAEQVSPTSPELAEFFVEANGARNPDAAAALLERKDAGLRDKLCAEIVETDFLQKAKNASLSNLKAMRISSFCQEKKSEFTKQQREVGTLEEERKKVTVKKFSKTQADVGQLGEKASQFEAGPSNSPSKASASVGKLGQKASKFEEASLKQAAEEAAAAEREAARLKAQEEARLRAEQTEVSRQKALEEEAAAKRKAAEEEARMKEAKELEKQNAAQEVARQKAVEVEAAAKKKAVEEQEARLRAEEEERATKHNAHAQEQASELERQYQELQRQTKLQAEKAEAEGNKIQYEIKKADFEERLRQAKKQLEEAEGHIQLLDTLIGFIRDDLQHQHEFHDFSQAHAHDNSEQYLEALNATLKHHGGFGPFKDQAAGASETLKQAYANYAKARDLLKQIQHELAML